LTDVDPPIDDTTEARGVWLSVSELASARGVSKQNISATLKRWADAGVPVTTRRQGRETLVNVVEFDRRRGDQTDLGRQLSQQTRKIAGADHPVYAREQALRARYDAELKRLDLEERMRRLIPLREVEDALVACGETFVHVFEQLEHEADEIAIAVSQGGIAGARRVLKQVTLRQRIAAADALEAIGKDLEVGAPPPDPAAVVGGAGEGTD
jgi:hypothetical protein